MSDSLQSHGLYIPWNSLGQNTGVASLNLLQGIFPTQGSNPGLPHCRWILYQLSHKGSPNSRWDKIMNIRIIWSLSHLLIKQAKSNSYIKDVLVFISVAAAAAKSLQSCPTLCDPIDGSPRGSPVPGILQARTLEWVAISFSNAWKWKVKVKSLSDVQLLATPWTAAYQGPPSMGFSRQECWSGVPLPSLIHFNNYYQIWHALLSRKNYKACQRQKQTQRKKSNHQKQICIWHRYWNYQTGHLNNLK